MNECERLWGRILVSSRILNDQTIGGYRRAAAHSRNRQLIDAYFDAIEDEMNRREAGGYEWITQVSLKPKARF